MNAQLENIVLEELIITILIAQLDFIVLLALMHQYLALLDHIVVLLD